MIFLDSKGKHFVHITFFRSINATSFWNVEYCFFFFFLNDLGLQHFGI